MSSISTGIASSRKRAREYETDSQRTKREKAAERQRRKRERDRRNATLQQQQQQQSAQVGQPLQPSAAQAPPAVTQSAPPDAEGQEYVELSPDEIVRRERVRAAARERQRKHRMLVKQRRMRELGLDMGNEILPGMEEVHYRAAPDGQYHQVLPPDLQQQVPPPPPPQPPNPLFAAAIQAPHQVPHGPAGGQTFASTLLLSFSCAPLLKQHLLRTLGMSNDELASLEPIIAEAWERWDQQRRLQHYEQMAKNGQQPPLPPPPYAADMNPFANPNGAPADPNNPTQAQVAAAADDFRARFHRSIVGPTPFRTFGDSSQTASTGSPSSGSNPEPTIDPHLASGQPGATGGGVTPAGQNGTTVAPAATVTVPANGTTSKSELLQVLSAIKYIEVDTLG